MRGNAQEQAGAFGRTGRTVETGWPGLDRALRAETEDRPHGHQLRGLVRGGVHEWIGTAAAKDTGDGRAPWSPPVLLLAHLGGRATADAAARGLGQQVVWIGRSVWPYPRILGGGYGVLEVLRPTDRALDGRGLELELALHERAESFRISDDGLFAHSLFVDVEGRDEASPSRRRSSPRSGGRRRSAHQLGRKLWAIDTALRCPSVTAVIADGSGLDMAASRRLQLVAARSQALVLLTRPPEERGEISAATTRWWIEREENPGSERQESPGGEPGPRGVRWRVRLLRAKGAQMVGEAEQQSNPLHRTRPALEAVHELTKALRAGKSPETDEREDQVQRGGNITSNERSPCGASSPYTSPTSP